MGMTEIILIIIGVLVFILSFLLPAEKKGTASEEVRINENKIREMVENEVEEAKTKISDIVEETITYSMEKTERSMERLTNEKIMAVNEYSDTVLEEINKNHKEVVFLYDMLNDKHENLKSTVSEAIKTVSEVKQTVKDAEVTAREAEAAVKEAAVKEAVVKEAGTKEAAFQPMKPETVQVLTAPAEKKESERRAPVKAKPAAKKKSKADEQAQTEAPEVEVSLNAAGKPGGRNSNERILELHKAGKSNMAIARELGLGIGEVKLVIDLFEGI